MSWCHVQTSIGVQRWEKETIGLVKTLVFKTCRGTLEVLSVQVAALYFPVSSDLFTEPALPVPFRERFHP